MTKLVNRAKMITATTGTGSPITLGSAEDGYQSFADAGVADADVVRYVIEDGTAWEIGTGTYTASGTTLTRTVSESSNADAAINLSGSAVVYVTAAAADIQQVLAEGAFVDGDKTKLDGIEAGATADQTAAEILTAIKTVDGSGSGLDADLLDGNDSAAFYLATNPNGYTTNTGTVTSVAASVPTGFSLSGSPITSSGTLGITYAAGYQGYTTTEATKLSGIEANADVTDAANVQPLVDAHLNTGTATTGEVLSWTGTDYDWITAGGGGATDINGLSDAYSDGYSIGLGNSALASDDGTLNYNIGIGVEAGQYVTSGADNFLVGYRAGFDLTTGARNICIGNQAGSNFTTHSDNIILGDEAVRNATSATTMIAIGKSAGSYGSYGGIAIGQNAQYYTTGSSNIGIGYAAIYGTSGTATGSSNIGIGYRPLYDLTAGRYNFAAGYDTLTNLTAGDDNVAIGYFAGLNLTTGDENVFIGKNAGELAVTSSASVNIGREAGRYSPASNNVYIGAYAGRGTSGTTTSSSFFNSAVGFFSGAAITTGGYNSLFGYYSGNDITTGSNNVAVGREAGETLTTGSNNILLGYNAQPTSATVSNEITLGNSSIATLRCQVTTITSLSDARDKTDIQPLDAGLDFVNALEPVSFTWNMRDGGKVGVADTGFIAQDLKRVQEETGVTIPHLVFDANPEKLEAGYGKLIPVLVQAIKDLSAKVDELEAKLEAK